MSSHQQPPNFRDFLQSFDPNRAPGQGIDHHSAPSFGAGFFPFGGPGGRHPHPPPPGAWPWGNDATDFDEWNPWVHRGPWGRRGRRHGHNTNEDAPRQEPDQQGSDNERDEFSETTRAENTDDPDPAEVVPEDSGCDDDHLRGRHGRRGGHGRGGRGRCGRAGGPFRHGPHHGAFYGPFPGPHRGAYHPPPPPPYSGFDFNGLMRTIGSHPILQNLHDYIPANNNTSRDGSTDIDTFSPPVDTFDTPAAYVLHAALPGARKEDVGVSWDADSRSVRIAGVVHRPGDEAFLATLQGGGERRVGMFERQVVLPGEDEVEGMGISAKMEDGVLVVTVPKVPRGEKEWTEIHKVDVE